MSSSPRRVVCVVHGGAGYIQDAVIPVAKAGVSEACNVGYGALISGQSALDAVESAVRVLEDLPFFNAGRGSVLNKSGYIEMDALIADGKNIRVGAVTLVHTVKNPISLARKVMEDSPHVFLAGEGAESFAVSAGLETVDPKNLITTARISQLKQTLADELPVTALQDPAAAVGRPDDISGVDVRAALGDCKLCDEGDHDTVGAVAIDTHGNVAAATSTGGLTAKWVGRVGDTPVFGAGGYADNEVGACSTTGTGEYIIRALLAKSVCDAYAHCKDANAAVHSALALMKRKVGGPGAGVIFVAPDGEVGVAHSSQRMSWAACRGTSLSDKEEVVEAEIPHEVAPGIKAMKSVFMHSADM